MPPRAASLRPRDRPAQARALMVALTAALTLLPLAACTPEPGPAATGSRSAILASRTGEVARQAERVANHAASIEGLIDAWRAAPPDQRADIEARIQAEALIVQAEAEAVQKQVEVIEDGARVWTAPP